MSLDLVPPIPFPLPHLLHPGFCFSVLLYYFSVCFCVFGVFLQFLPIFTTPVSLPSVHCCAFFVPPPQWASTMLFFVWGQHICNQFLFLYFFLLVFSSAAFLFLVFCLLFACNNALPSMVRLDPLWSWLVCCGCVCYPSF